uniref:Uncharacterized protein n=1 Tax=Ahnfeltia plicata TaxID=28023 RepID=A0A1C9CB80_9FLOR|nr:hypothetical protein Ahnf_147 [Ahnfeltia plicata]AOM65632.1 hypothetical protein Ahnf_147 [Ahnfeltia plicata]UAT97213.1 hypothetical protein Ahn.pli.UK.pt_104 [Ahnfeltia plicata]UAT97418.1 hypothetical protein Ahn.pli.Chile.pt_104 [Ahnfeltia plicata]
MKIISIKRDLDILIIAIEAIDIYALDNISHYSDKSDIFLIRSGNKNRDTGINKRCTFQETLLLISKFQDILSAKYLQNIIYNILKDYSNLNQSSQITYQYLWRFQYLYKKTYDFANTSHYYDTELVNIEQIAIISLYILNQLYLKHGTYMLIKYIYLNINSL